MRSGESYNGLFADGKMHGKGIYISDTDRYEGEFKDDKEMARATMFWFDDAGRIIEKFEGVWKRGKRYNGEHHFADGGTYRAATGQMVSLMVVGFTTTPVETCTMASL